MASLYDRADIYDLIETDERNDITKRHWERVLSGKRVGTLLDVSIGSGDLTLPLAELGVRLYGSDLSEPMLKRCREKAAKREFPIERRLLPGELNRLGGNTEIMCHPAFLETVRPEDADWYCVLARKREA